MKERLLQWFVFVLVVSTIGGEKSHSEEDEEDTGYDIRTNGVDEQDDATSRMLQLIKNAALKIVEAPDLSKVIGTSVVSIHFYFFCKFL